MANPDETLTFELDTDRLMLVLAALDARRGELTYPEAWRALVTEERKRRQNISPSPIRLRRDVFDALPDVVRGFMDIRVAHVTCTHCGHPNRMPAKFLELLPGPPLVKRCDSCRREFEIALG